MIELFPWDDREHCHHLDISPRILLEAVEAAGGDMDTLVTLDSDGEPVYVECYPGTGIPE